MQLVSVYDAATLFCCISFEYHATGPRKTISSGGASACARGRWPYRLVKSKSGSVLVEFSIVALPFFLFLMGAVDIGFYYWGSQELENATAHGARLVRTGQVQANAIDQAQLKAEICGKTAVLVGCASRLRIDVRSGQSLAAITPPSPLNGSGALKSDAEFDYLPGLPTTSFSCRRSLIGGSC